MLVKLNNSGTATAGAPSIETKALEVQCPHTYANGKQCPGLIDWISREPRWITWGFYGHKWERSTHKTMFEVRCSNESRQHCIRYDDVKKVPAEVLAIIEQVKGR